MVWCVLMLNVWYRELALKQKQLHPWRGSCQGFLRACSSTNTNGLCFGDTLKIRRSQFFFLKSEYLEFCLFSSISCYICIFFLFSFFLVSLGHMEVPRLRVKLELQLPTYTTAHGNTESSTRVRSGIEPATSWLLVRFVSTAPQRELHPALCFLTLCTIMKYWLYFHPKEIREFLQIFNYL